jgi:hypothetical protein
MRFFACPIALLVLLAGSAAPMGDTARPLQLAGPHSPAANPVALLAQSTGTRVTTIDRNTLMAIRPRSAPLGAVDAWAFGPDGSQLAVAAHANANLPEPDSIRLVSLPMLKLVAKRVSLDGSARAVLWARAARIVALVGYCCPDTTAVEVVDPPARRVVGRQELDGAVVATARAEDSLVLLAAPRTGIGASRLLVVAADGTVRTVGLERIAAGYFWPDQATDPIGAQRIPALTVDTANSRAFVLSPDGLAAEIDLRTLGVSYHELAAPRSLVSRLTDWLQPSAQAKGLNGPARYARWLGNGLIALTGSDETATRDASGQASFRSDPAGLAIVDTRDWTVRMLDRGADWATIADDALLATGRSWSSASRRATGMGLAVYGPDRALRFHLWRGTSAWVDAVWAGRGYIDVTNAGRAKIFVIDLGSGRVIRERKSPVPVPLLGDGPDF